MSTSTSTSKRQPSKRQPQTRRQKLDLVNFMVKKVPVKLKRALIKEAEQQGSSMNDVAVGALAEHFKVPFIPSGRVPPTGSTGTNGMVGWKMPRRLRRKINMKSADLDMTSRDLVIQLLTERFLGEQ